MDFIAICLACQLTAQLPALDASVPTAFIDKNLERPYVFSGQSAAWMQSQTAHLEVSLQSARTSLPVAVSSQPFWTRWWQAFTGKSADLQESTAQSDDSADTSPAEQQVDSTSDALDIQADIQETTAALETDTAVTDDAVVEPIEEASTEPVDEEPTAEVSVESVDEEPVVAASKEPVNEEPVVAEEVATESAVAEASVESAEEELVVAEEASTEPAIAAASTESAIAAASTESTASEESDTTVAETGESIVSPQTARVPYKSNTEPTRNVDRRVSPDVELLQLASTDLLGQEPALDAKAFTPAAGATFNADGTVTLRVLVGNPSERLTVIGDFNSWGNIPNLDAYVLYPSEGDPIVHEATLPPGDYHKAQYRLRDQNGLERLDLDAPMFSTPAFNTRFYGQRADNNLNSVFWKSTPIPEAELAPRVDLRGQQLVIAESDIASLALRWTCNVSDSRFFGQTGAGNISQLYSFVAECGLPEELAALGYNAVQFMPLDAHVDFWDPERFPFPDWRYSYINISFYAKHADFGSPDELKQMINAFHRSEVAVLIDVIYSHYSDSGNEPPREYYPLGFSQYHSEDGWELYGGPWTRWGTRRFSYTPAVRRNLVDAALVNILDYGFDGLRMDNVNGIDRQPEGRTFLRELTEAIALYEPKAVVIGEGYFGDSYLNKSRSAGGAGLLTTYSDRFYLWFTENIIKYRDEIDTRRLDYMLSNDWPLTLLYYPGNHDEFANPGNEFQTRGRYLSEAIQGGIHTRKIQSWSALAMFSSSYYLDMVQQWTLQSGSLNNNSLVDWDRFKEPYIAELAKFQGDMKRFYTSQPAFAAYNTHRHMLRWMDHDNKVAVFEKIDFTSGQRVYAVVNLGDEAIDNYKIPVFPDGASFRLALDSDESIYGGSGKNSEWLTSDNRELEFFLGSYGVVGLVQQDKFELPPADASDSDIDVDRPTGNWYY